MTERPQLYLLCGLPFSGKSTLARAMAVRLGLVHLEVDRINAEREVGLSGEPIAKEDWIVAYRATHRRLETLLRAGDSVVYDATSFRRSQRNRVRRIAARCGAETTVVFLDLPAAEAWRRLLLNRRMPARVDVRDEDFVQVAEGFQPPSADEAAVRHDGSVVIEEWIRRLPRPSSTGSTMPGGRDSDVGWP